MSTENRSTPLLSDLLCFALYSASHAMSRAYRPLLKKLGVTYPQYLVLLSLWQTDGQLVGDIGKSVHLDSNTLTPLLKRLEALALISRQRDREDERKVRVHLTPRGASLQDDAACISDQIINAAGLTDESMKGMTRQIAALRETLTANPQSDVAKFPNNAVQNT